jgi:hypothetical protein
LKIYQDKIEIDTLTVTSDNTFGTNGVEPTRLFASDVAFYSNQICSGALDDVRVYNRPLSQTEIDALYAEGGWSGN